MPVWHAQDLLLGPWLQLRSVKSAKSGSDTIHDPRLYAPSQTNPRGLHLP